MFAVLPGVVFAEDVIWTDTVGVSVNGNSLTKTASDGWGNAGAASVQSISGDGYVEFTASMTNKARFIGLSNNNANAHYNTIGYGLNASSNGSLIVFENGTSRGNQGPYATGDILRIERTGTTITYKRNGNVVYTSTVPSTGTLIADVSMNHNGVTLNNAKISDTSGGQNSPPTANAGQNQTVDEGTTVTLAGSGTDSDGTITAYSWTQTSGPSVTINNSSSATADFTAPQVSATTNLVFQLQVTDNDGATDTDTVTVTVIPISASETWVMFGDSITAGGTWPATLANSTSNTVVNAGHGGDTTNDALNRLQTDVLDQDPDTVFIMFGVNDQRVPDGSSPDAYLVPPAQFSANLDSIISQIQAIGANVVLMTNRPIIQGPGAPDYNFYLDRHGDGGALYTLPRKTKSTIRIYNDIIRQQSIQYSLPLVDIWKAVILRGNGTDSDADILLAGIDKPGTSNDGVHPGPAGDQLIADTIISEIPFDYVSDNTAPVISNITIDEVTYNSVTISWVTDEMTTSNVLYGQASVSESSTGPYIDPGLLTHSIVITGLDSSTAYSYQIESTDLFGNESTSAVFGFSTLMPPSILPAQPVIWTDTVGVSVDGNSLTKTAGDGWGNAGAVSVQSIPGDGYVEFTASMTDKARFIGLSTVSTSDHFNTIHYGLNAASNGTIFIYENGTSRGSYDSYATGDILRVERTGTIVTYKLNGMVVYTSTVPSTGDLIADVALNHNGVTLNDAIIFGATAPTGSVPPVAEDGTLSTYENTAANGVLVATDINGDPLTYSIVSNGSKGTAVITNTSTGAYTYTPNTNANGSDSFTFKANDGTVDSNTATIDVTITPAVNNPPDVPGGFTTGAVNDNQIDLSWTASTDSDGVAGYQLERCQGSSCSNFAPVTERIITLDYSDIGLDANTSYRYRVRAIDTLGATSGYSTIQATTTLSVPASVPLAPMGSGAVITGTELKPLVAGSYDVSNTGSFTYTLPIVVPTGTSHMQPDLSLNYDSRQGNGLLGVGWSLSGLSIIHRCQPTVEQDGFRGGINYDGNDRYCLDGQRLIAINGADGGDGTEYRTELESFAKIISHASSSFDHGPDSFEVWTKNGSKIYFGLYTTTNSRVTSNIVFNGGSGSSGGNSFYKPTPGEEVPSRAWAVDRIEDRMGNYMIISYNQDPDNGEHYPAQIDYTGNDSPGVGLATYNHVEFEYTITNRDDVLDHYVRGTPVRYTKLLSKVKTYYQGTEVKEYRLSYLPSSVTNRSLLQSIEECNGSGMCKDPLTFTWSGLASMSAEFDMLPDDLGVNDNGWSSSHLVNINDDGLPDLVLPYDSKWQIRFNTGSGFGPMIDTGIPLNGTEHKYAIPFDNNMDGKGDILVSYGGVWHIMQANPAGTGLDDINTGLSSGGYANAKLMDINGDGYADIVLCTSNRWRVRLHTGTSFGPSIDTGIGVSGYSYAQVYDYNGDGIQDLLVPYANGDWYLFKWNDGLQTFDLTDTGVPDTGKQDTHMIDINGDTLLDQISGYGSSGTFYIRLNNGAGFNDAIDTGISKTQFDIEESLLIDYDEDGNQDLLIPDDNNGFQLTLIHSTGETLELTSVTLDANGWDHEPKVADLNGDGRTDVLVSTGGTWRQYIRHSADLAPAPDLIVRVPNVHVADTEITYQPLINQETGSVFPVMDIKSALTVVSTISEADGISGDMYTTQYAFSGAKQHFTRGFLGFASNTITDLENGIYTVNTFRQDYPYTGMVAQTTTYTGVGAILSDNVNTFSAISYGGTRYFPYISQSDSTANDLDGTPLPTTTATTTYDTYGNVTQAQTDVNDVSGLYRTITSNTYATPDTANWFVGKRTQTTVESQVPSYPSHISTSAFSYTPEGLVLSETVEPGAGDPLEVTTSYAYDGFGNVTQATVQGGVVSRTSWVAYDSEGRFVASRTNALGHQETLIFDQVEETLTSQTGPNGLTTMWYYDDFGRKIQEVRADGTQMLWSYLVYSGLGVVCPSGASGTYHVVVSRSSGGATGYTCFDGLGRKRQTTSQSFDGEWLGTLTEYDHFGRVLRTSLPDKSSNGQMTPAGWGAVTYDVIGRVTQTQAADGTTVTHTYSGLTTTTQNALLQQSTTYKNAIGQVIEVVNDDNDSTYYEYDAAGNLVTVTDALGNIVTMGYDQLGRKVFVNDPDTGFWQYQYDNLGELTWQQDAKGQTVTMSYDELGRLVSRSEAEGTTTWYYDTAPHGIGKLDYVAGPDGYVRTQHYDFLGRPISTTATIDNQTFAQGLTYDEYSRVVKGTYPTGFTTDKVYTPLGYLERVRNTHQPSLSYWQPDAIDNAGRVTMATVGNGLTTVTQFDPLNGHLLGISTGFGSNSDVQYLTYDYDDLGNLTQRTDANQGLTETFIYDNLNRLTASSIGGIGTKTYGYDAIGNLISKSDVGSYTYGQGSARPHAVTAVNGTVNGVTNPTFSYDNNGNMITGAGRTISYTSYNKPSQVTANGSIANFTYAPDRARIIQETADATTLYVGGSYEQISDNADTVTHKHYIPGGGGTVAVYTYVSDSTSDTRYLHHDHLGSTDTITDENGTVVERLSYDAFGQRRQSDWQDATGPITSLTPYGFTGQEHLEESGLIHMNGRVYDPELGRFISADPFVQYPDSQGLNRYTYVNNNPLGYTDPTGHFSLGRTLGSGLIHPYAMYVQLHNHALKQSPNIVLPVVTAVAGFYGGPEAAGLYSAYATMVLGGTPRQALLNGARTFATAWAFQQIGLSGEGEHPTPTYIRVMAHGTVGGLDSYASGGSFRAGFASGVFASALAEPIGTMFPRSITARTAAAMAIGGGASVVAGGNFRDGATIAALSHLMNYELHPVVRAAQLAVRRAVALLPALTKSFPILGILFDIPLDPIPPDVYWKMRAMDLQQERADILSRDWQNYRRDIEAWEANPQDSEMLNTNAAERYALAFRIVAYNNKVDRFLAEVPVPLDTSVLVQPIETGDIHEIFNSRIEDGIRDYGTTTAGAAEEFRGLLNRPPTSDPIPPREEF